MAAVAAAALFLLAAFLPPAIHSIGVNYGILGDNLPPPSQVAQFLKDKTTIDRIKIFDPNPDILRAFANTGILVAVTIPNNEIPNLTDLAQARAYVSSKIKPFLPQTRINYLLVGNEILQRGPQNLRDNLVSAMRSLHDALQQEGITGISVTTAHSLYIMEPSDLPSQTKFRDGWDRDILAPMLQFHQDTKTPFMVNPYPYFAYSPEKADFVLFKPSARPVFDESTGMTYTNMFDLMLDSVYVSMTKLGFKDVEIVVGETGWSSQGETYEQPKCSVDNAEAYNGGLVGYYNSGKGTPLMPRKMYGTYVFGLFNENQKTGSLAERNFGLFRPDFSPVYDAGIMKAEAGGAPGPVSKKWCVPKPNASESALQKNIEYVCSQGVDCKPVNPGGACFIPDNVRDHAKFVMNSFYQAKGRTEESCDFAGTGLVTTSDPSTGTCKYTSSQSAVAKWLRAFFPTQ